jgi:large subunit ribosomal protein L10
MSKYIKGLIQTELEQRLGDGEIKEFIVLSLMGVGGVDNNVMRGDLKEKGVNLFVVSNSLFKRALRTKEMDNACDLFSGPSAIVYGGDSIVDAAKELSDWSKKINAMEVKGAYLDGTVLNAQDAKDLAKMPTRKELQAQIAGCILSPAANLASAIAGPASQVAGCIKSVIENAEKQAA